MHREYAIGLPWPDAVLDLFGVLECEPVEATPAPFDPHPHPPAIAPAITAQAANRRCRFQYMSAPSS
jgi:hypothetical protein